MKRDIRIIAILLFAAATVSCLRKVDYDYSRWYKDDSDDDGLRRISVMTFNVRTANEGDTGDRAWTVRRNGVFEMMKTIHPIIMGSQECESVHMEDITSALPEYHVIAPDLATVPKEECAEDAIFYIADSLHVLSSGTFYLTGTPDTPSRLPQSIHYRVCTWAKFRLVNGGQEFFCFNTHFDYTAEELRVIQMGVVIDKMKEINPDGLPIYLTGDMNTDESEKATFKPLLDYGFSSARVNAVTGDSHLTFNAYGDYKGSIYDHCFYKNFHSVPKFVTVRDPFAGLKYISDHYPVNIVLKFNDDSDSE